MSRSQQSIKNITIAVIGQFFGLVISFFSRIFFIRILGNEYLGLNGLFTNILTILSLAELGIGEAITYSLYRPLAKKNTGECKKIMAFYKKTYITIGTFILVVGIIITPLLPMVIKDMPDIPYINLIYILFVINTSCSYFFSYKKNLIIADQNRYITIIYKYTFYFILNVCQIILLILTKNYILFLILQIILTFLENICISKKADKMYPYLKEKKCDSLDKITKESIIKNTKAMMLHKIGGVVVNSTDNILLSSFIGLEVVGIYSNYYMVINALDTIFKQLFGSVTASIGNLVVDASDEKKYSTFKNIFFANFWIYSMASVCLICLFNSFIELWLGKEYLFSFYVVLILVVNFYITGMRKTVITFKEASGLFYQDRWKAVIEAVVNLGFSILFVIKFGAFGVFLGTFISSISVCVWFEAYVLFKNGFKKNVWKYFFKKYLKYACFTVIIAIVTYLLCSLIKSGSFISFLLKMIIALFFSNFMIFLFYHKSEEFKYLYEKILKNILLKITKR